MQSWSREREVEKVKQPKTPSLSIGSESALLITHAADDDWNVWISLPDHDPVEDSYGFIVGSGSTRDDAVASAVRDLETLLERLQSPPGHIRERKQ